MSARDESRPVARNDVLRLRGILESFSQLNEAEDFHQYENTISELVKLLDSVLDAALSDPGNEQEENNAFEVVSVIYRYICSPSLDQALGSSSKMAEVSAYVAPPLSGLSKVFISFKRRQFEQIKEAIPMILNVLKNMSLQTDEAELEGVFGKVVEVANSIYAICTKMWLASYLKYPEDKDDYVGCLSHVKHGAALSVIWGYLDAIMKELRCTRTKRWEALGTLKHALSFVNLPWELKRHTINFLLCVIDGHVYDKYVDELYEWSTYMPNVFSALQATKMVIMYAPDTEHRKKSFDLFKRVLDDIPISQRQTFCER